MFRFGKTLLFWAALVVAGFATPAQAITIDFQDLEGSGRAFDYVGGTYTYDDFTLTNLTSNTRTAFAIPETGNSRYNTGSTSMLNNRVNGVTQLAASDGSAFDLESIDLSELASNRIGDTSVTFTGTYEDGTTVEQTFDLDGVWGMETFYFDGFDSVISVTWTQTADFHQFDNISVEISPVPLPASSVLLGSVLGVGAFASRRRRRRGAG
ncbi:PEP-CTERM sorting domain-containing protein [Aliiruegeria lutimaris]|uniref:PEP-CTERM protein-sorting domain-containing protein n=1 Tax=Aliiruegeria lutimaris TaxID=571298 RepID=A0A1G8LQJ9_9RHOB|nr:PEP-CTERM sorting domain-containing protein [Aliiruegeria lutimaris]SDI57991.1 PEP-CTERM protein-sorting domain-containing protein [Aliiruegeria lutimaris]